MFNHFLNIECHIEFDAINVRIIPFYLIEQVLGLYMVVCLGCISIYLEHWTYCLEPSTY